MAAATLILNQLLTTILTLIHLLTAILTQNQLLTMPSPGRRYLADPVGDYLDQYIEPEDYAVNWAAGQREVHPAGGLGSR